MKDDNQEDISLKNENEGIPPFIPATADLEDFITPSYSPEEVRELTLKEKVRRVFAIFIALLITLAFLAGIAYPLLAELKDMHRTEYEKRHAFDLEETDNVNL